LIHYPLTFAFFFFFSLLELGIPNGIVAVCIRDRRILRVVVSGLCTTERVMNQ
jgi:hypothetical protein